jgi:2C-methyl-D-erythritol 2,4-cyclodiphosphate synthase
MATFVEDRVGGGVGGSDSGLGLLAILAATGALGGRRDDKNDCIAAQLNTAADGINHNINTSMIGLTNQLNSGFGGQRDLDLMQKLGNIEGDIWKAEGQVQLAVAGSTAAISDRITAGTISNLEGQAVINKNISDAIASSLASQSAIKESVAAYGVANLTATKDAQYALSTAVRDDGDKTRELLVRQYEDTINRELSEARNALVEQRAITRGRETEINITNTNTATAVAQQAQSMQQQQLQILASIASEMRNLANDIQVVRQTQSNVNFGTQTGTAQTASAANNRVG